MKKVMRLVSIQLWVVLGDMLSIGNNRKRKPKLLYTGVILFLLLMSGLSFFYSYMIGIGLKMFGSLDILPAMMMAITCLMVLVTTVLKVKGTIFGFRDYDMVMSLPVSTGTIVASRLIILYALNMAFVIIVMFPMIITYGILSSPNTMFYAISFISMFFLPLVPIVVASFLGTIIAYAASKFRYSNLLNIIFSVGFLAAFVTLSFTLGDKGEELVDISRSLTNQVNSMYPLAQMYTNAVVNSDISAFVLFLAISIIAFLLYTMIVQKVFKKMNTVIMTGRYRVNYKLGELKTGSPFKALYIKEFKRYFSSPLYVLNTGFGIVLLTLGAIAIIFVDLDKLIGDQQAAQTLIKSGPIFISFCVVMCCTTMSSISLEGKNLWIVKSIPVATKTIYIAKIAVNLTIISPAIFDAILIGIILKMGFVQTLFLVLTTIVCAFFISFFGLIMNLLLPNFNWTTEVVVIKQSAATMIALFTGMGIVGVQYLFLLFLPSMTIAYLSYCMLIVIIDVMLYRILMTYGKRRFNTL